MDLSVCNVLQGLWDGAFTVHPASGELTRSAGKVGNSKGNTALVNLAVDNMRKIS
jgi:hypothetical protein